MAKVEVRSARNYGPRRPGLVCEDASLTHQEFARECDINEIMRKYEKHGILTHVREVQEQFIDVAGLPEDYHSALNYVRDVEALFATLPASAREAFQNDPSVYLDALQSDDPDVKDRLHEMGLITGHVPREPNPRAGPAPKAQEGAEAPAAEPEGGAPAPPAAAE